MDFTRLLTSTYWFDTNPGIQTTTFKGLLILSLIIAAFGGLMFINKLLYPKVRAKLGYLLVTSGLLSILLLFFRFEGVYLLSARFLYLLLIIIMLIWAVVVLVYLIKDYPTEIKNIEEYQKFSTYLPKKKHK